MDFPHESDLFRVGRDEALRRSGKLTLQAIERDGSDINIDVAVSAATGGECISQLAIVTAGTYIDSAKGQALDRLLFDRYSLLRNPAAPALGSVVFTVTVGGVAIPNPAAFTIPTGTVLEATDGNQFVTTADQQFGAGATSVTVPVRSVLAGADQQAAIGTITAVISQVAGGPASPNSLSVTNTLATAGAADEESDDSFRNRGRAFFLTARRGTLSALVQGALAVPGVTTAKPIEVIDALGRPARLVQLMITDQYTDQLANLAQTVPAYQAQSQVLAASVFSGLDEFRCAGIFVQVTVAKTIMLPVALRLAFSTSAPDIDLVAQEARAAVVSYTNSLPPGTTWSRTAVQALLQTIAGLVYTGLEVASPPGDVVPTPLQALRTSLGIVSAISATSDRLLVVSTDPDAFTPASG